MSKYPYLLAALPDPPINKRITAEQLEEIRETIEDNLSAADKRAFGFLLLPRDLARLRKAIFKRAKGWEAFTPEGQGILDGDALDAYPQRKLEMPDFLFQLFSDWESNFEQWTEREIEQKIYSYFFEAIEKQGSIFIKEWYAFERDLRNLTIFFQPSEYGFDTQEELLPDDFLTPLLFQGRASEKKLIRQYPFVDRLKETLAKGDPVRISLLLRELRWEKLEELAGYIPFTTEQVFARFLKLEIATQHSQLSDGKPDSAAMEKGKAWLESRMEEAMADIKLKH